MSDIVPIAVAAERIGRPPQWLRRRLLAHERRTGHTVLIRVGEGRKRPTYNVEMGQLRIMCPELFDKRDPIATALHSAAIVGRRIEGRIEDLEATTAELAAAVRRLSAAQSRRP